MTGQRILIVLAAPYVVWLMLDYEYHFIDGVNLAFHETGHLVFAFFGQTLHVLGGTLLQLFFPAACIGHFLVRQRLFEAALCGVWLAESLMYTAWYMADARAQRLPLVGGGDHDWHWLLGNAGLLEYAETLGLILHVGASLLALAALGWATHLAFFAPAPGKSACARATHPGSRS